MPVSKAYACKHCGAAFPSLEELLQHGELVAHTSAVDDWICPDCGKHFTSPGQLAEHEAKVH